MSKQRERVPNGLRYANLKELTHINPRHFSESAADDDLVSFVPMKAVEEETGRLDASEKRPWKMVKKGYTPFQDGDVLFAKITPCMENGKFALATGLYGGRAVGSTEFHVFRPSSELDAKYLLFYLFNPNLRLSAKSNMKGTAGQLRVPGNFFEEQVIPLPSLSVQKSIVAEIEKQFTRLEAGVSALKHMQANLKRYRASVLKAACEGRLVPTEAELSRQEGRTYEPAGVLMRRTIKEAIHKNRRDDNQKNKHHHDQEQPNTNELSQLPEGWTWTAPKNLALSDKNAICAGPFGTIFKAKDFRPAGVPIIFLRHVAPGKYLTKKPGFMDTEKWNELFKPYSVYGGELLITKLGDPPGVCAIYPQDIGPAMVTPDVIKMSVNEKLASPKFLMCYFNSETSRHYATGVAFGTTRLRLTIPIFRDLPVPLPPIAEQHRIVSEVECRLSVIDELEAVFAANLNRAERLRQSILQHAFSGRLT